MDLINQLMCFIVIILFILLIVAWEDTLDFIKKLLTISFNKKKFQLAVYKKYSKL